MSEPTDVQALIQDADALRGGLLALADMWRAATNSGGPTGRAEAKAAVVRYSACLDMLTRLMAALDAQQAEVQRLTAEVELQTARVAVHLAHAGDLVSRRDAQVREARAEGFDAGWDARDEHCGDSLIPRNAKAADRAAHLASRQPAGAQPEEPGK